LNKNNEGDAHSAPPNKTDELITGVHGVDGSPL